jgi:hypothetical protein
MDAQDRCSDPVVVIMLNREARIKTSTAGVDVFIDACVVAFVAIVPCACRATAIDDLEAFAQLVVLRLKQSFAQRKTNWQASRRFQDT